MLNSIRSEASVNGVVKEEDHTVPNAVNYNNLLRELQWLNTIIKFRIGELEQPSAQPPIELPELPIMFEDGSTYGQFVEQNNLTKQERLVLILALAPHIRPQILDPFAKDKLLFQQAKLARNSTRTALLPTADTALFLISGMDLGERMTWQHVFEAEHVFYQKSVLEIGTVPAPESIYSGVLGISQTFRDLFTQNRMRRPKFSEDFPAQLLTTKLEWEDLVLGPRTREKLTEAIDHLEVYDHMVKEWNMQKHSVDGCRLMFHGDSGTGKTLAAKLIGKHLNKDVYRVDISTVTSKYIGETSKRLNSLFNIAESKGWILFFDEGDALFSQRKNSDQASNTSQYANQDVAFLLQRIENYDGIIIVATNLRGNVDKAFTRRFEHIINFELPDVELRMQLWNAALPDKVQLPAQVHLEDLIRQYSLAPAAIINVVYRLCRMTYKKNTTIIDAQDLLRCFKDEDLKNKGRASFNQQ